MTASLTSRMVVGYFPGQAIHAQNYHVSDIPLTRLTHINYAFAPVSTTGVCVSANPQDDGINFPALQALARRQPGLKILISVGGPAGSGPFSSAAKTAAGRQTLAKSCVSFMKQAGFNGIDLAWEYPAGADKTHFTLLLKDLRSLDWMAVPIC
jgi:chitinase